MIRFACPGCSSTFSVDDSKAGKSGKCPKCGAAFIIPSPEPEAAAASPPPAPLAPATDPNAPVEIDPCPKCQTKLSVAASDLGNDVECPYCKTVFASSRAGTRPPAPPPPAPGRKSGADLDFSGKPKSRRVAEDNDDDDRPRRRRRDDDDEDERPSRRNRRSAARRDDDDDDDDRPSRRKAARNYDDEDDEDDYRPRRRSRGRSRRAASGERSGAVTAASVMTIVVGVLWLIGAGMVLFGFTTALGALGAAPRGGFNNQGRAAAENILLGATLCCGLPTLFMAVLHFVGGIFSLQRKMAGRILVIICASIGLILGVYILYLTMRLFFFIPIAPPFESVLMLFVLLLATLGYGTFAMIVMCRSDFADEFE